MRRLICTVAACALLAGCAGREAHPVSVTQIGDDTLTCPAIQAQIEANQAQARSLDSQRADHNATNAVVGVVGAVLFWPALFALDLTDYEKQEMGALRDRNTYLAQVSLNKGCNKPTTAAVTP